MTGPTASLSPSASRAARRRSRSPDEPRPLLADLEEGEGGDDHEHRQADRGDEAVGNSHPVTRGEVRGELQNLSV